MPCRRPRRAGAGAQAPRLPAFTAVPVVALDRCGAVRSDDDGRGDRGGEEEEVVAMLQLTAFDLGRLVATTAAAVDT